MVREMRRDDKSRRKGNKTTERNCARILNVYRKAKRKVINIEKHDELQNTERNSAGIGTLYSTTEGKITRATGEERTTED